MEIGPLRLVAVDEFQCRIFPNSVIEPTHWMLMQVYPTPPRLDLMYVMVPIVADRVIFMYDMENAFHTMKYLVAKGEI